MAVQDPFGQVYRGVPGTGMATVYEGNAAADIFNSNISRQTQERRMQEYQRQKQLADQQQNITNNLAKISPGEYWVNHNNEIKTDYDNLINYGNRLKYEGKDPFADSNFLSMREGLLSKANTSRQLRDEYGKLQAEITKNPNAYDNIDDVLSYYTGNKTLSDYMREGYKRPTLAKKYATEDLLEGLKPTTVELGDGNKITVNADSMANKQQVLSKLNTPAFDYLIKKAGGNEGLPAFADLDENGLPIFPTDDKYVTELATGLLDTPEGQQMLGGDVQGASALEKMKSIIKKQNEAYGKVVEDATKALDAQANTKYRKDDMNARLGLAYKADARAQQRADEKKQENDYLKQLRLGALNGDQQTINTLNAELQPLNGKARYDNNSKTLEILIPIEEKDKGGDVIRLSNGSVVSIPNGKSDKVTENGKKFRRYKIGSTSGQQADITLNNLFKELGLMKKTSTPDELGESSTSSMDELRNKYEY